MHSNTKMRCCHSSRISGDKRHLLCYTKCEMNAVTLGEHLSCAVSTLDNETYLVCYTNNGSYYSLTAPGQGQSSTQQVMITFQRTKQTWSFTFDKDSITQFYPKWPVEKNKQDCWPPTDQQTDFAVEKRLCCTTFVSICNYLCNICTILFGIHKLPGFKMFPLSVKVSTAHICCGRGELEQCAARWHKYLWALAQNAALSTWSSCCHRIVSARSFKPSGCTPTDARWAHPTFTLK